MQRHSLYPVCLVTLTEESGLSRKRQKEEKRDRSTKTAGKLAGKYRQNEK
jgi:hypothetical protein